MESTSTQIKMVLIKKGVRVGALAEMLGQSRQNLSNKLARDNFTIAELKEIARVLEIDFESKFVFPDGTRI